MEATKMSSLGERIQRLEDRIRLYEDRLDVATLAADIERWSSLILSTRESLNLLLLQQNQNPTPTFTNQLKDGLPTLRQIMCLSPPSIPSEAEHAKCRRIVKDLPYLPVVSSHILNASNSSWMKLERDEDGNRFRYYSSEDDIAHIVRNYLESILEAMDLPLHFNAEVTIKQVRPDIIVLLHKRLLVGVVEITKPNADSGRNVMQQPTVLGELLDQMLLAEGFYGMGPIVGILTTGEEWLVSWFPADTTLLTHVTPPEAAFVTPTKPFAAAESNISVHDEVAFAVPAKFDAAGADLVVSAHDDAGEATFMTPAKPAATEPKGYSPPGGTPSQKSGVAHGIEELMDEATEIDDNEIINQEMDRLLCTTLPLNIFQDSVGILQHLCAAFQLMANANTNHSPNVSRCLLKFHKGMHTVTFHPGSHSEIFPRVDFGRFPNANVKSLIALEDLGRGSTGKAWLCVTVTRPRSSACVLKFSSKHDDNGKLWKERDFWHLLYPEFKRMVKVEKWSGDDALMLPHFSTVLESERENYKDEVADVLNTRFVQKGKIHTDVRWRNMGKYRHHNGSVVIVVFDLDHVEEYNHELHQDWIESTIQSLYPNQRA